MAIDQRSRLSDAELYPSRKAACRFDILAVRELAEICAGEDVRQIHARDCRQRKLRTCCNDHLVRCERSDNLDVGSGPESDLDTGIRHLPNEKIEKAPI